MKTLLINPCLRPYSETKVVPVGLACIATALDRAGFETDILDIDLNRYSDEEVDARLEQGGYDMVGLGNIVSSYRVTKRLVQQVKRAMPDALLVVGNTVATSISELLLTRNPEVDIAVIGEGDRTIVELAAAVRDGTSWQGVDGIAYRADDTGGAAGTNAGIVFSEPRKPFERMADIPFPDFSLFDFEAYLDVSNVLVGDPTPLPREQMRALPINTARGCPFDCSFCTHAFKSYRYRYYPFEMVMKEFHRNQELCGVNYLAFYDELTLMSLARVTELCDAIEKEGVTVWWSINPRGNLFKKKDLDLLKRSYELGARTIGGALESGSPEILKAMNKHLKPDHFVEQMATAREAGIVPETSLVFGYPQETRESIRQTIDVCRRVSLFPSAGFVLPLPGTPIYTQAIERGLITDEEEYLLRIGDRQDLHINLTAMSDEELVGTVMEEMVKLKNDLGIPIEDEQVIKTTFYRAAEQAPADRIGDA